MAASIGVRVLRRLSRPVVRRALGTITHVSTADRVAALTFDDGPDPVWTPRLLSVLQAHQAHATFFMVGSRAARYPDVVRQVAAGGHVIGNHSWDHPSFPWIPGPERRRQIRACARAIAPYGSRLFRPPYGHQTRATRLDALRMGHDVAAWNVIAEDWLDHPAADMAERIAADLRPGSVILFHDGLADALDDRYFDRSATLDAVRLVLERFAGDLAFVTLPQLLEHGRAHREPWTMDGNVEYMNRLRRPDGTSRQYAVTR
jgi:peptidoglycan/xylan/chitin deacetylase (PgdA/CDA1 family)